MPCKFTEILFQRCTVFRRMCQQDLLREIGHLTVMLIEKCCNEFLLVFFPGRLHLISLASHQLTFPYKENDHMDLFLSPCRDHDVDVRCLMHNDALSCRQSFCSLDVITILGSFLKIESFRSFQHPLFQPSKDLTVFSVEEFPCPLDAFHIGLSIHFTTANTFALIYVIVQARAEPWRKRCGRASFQCETGVEKIHDLIDCARIAVRPEIPAPIFLNDPGLDDTRILFIRDLDIRICFVIPQQYIVFRTVFLDQIAL